MTDMWDRLRRKRPVEGPFKGIVIIDDLPTSDGRLTEDQAAALQEWHDLQVAAGNVGIGSLRIPDSEDLLKSLFDRADEET